MITQLMVTLGFADLMKNPLNVALICSIFEDSEHVFSKSRTRLYIEIVLLVLRRYEEKYGLASSNEDLISVYKKELLLLGRFALDSLRKGELYFEKNRQRFQFWVLVFSTRRHQEQTLHALCIFTQKLSGIFCWTLSCVSDYRRTNRLCPSFNQ